MFFFIPVGMVVALMLYQRLTILSAHLPLPLPGIVTKYVALIDPENELVLVLSAWYAIYFNSIFAAVFPVVTHRLVKGTGTKLAG